MTVWKLARRSAIVGEVIAGLTFHFTHPFLKDNIQAVLRTRWVRFAYSIVEKR
jgi:hypothetical protein